MGKKSRRIELLEKDPKRFAFSDNIPDKAVERFDDVLESVFGAFGGIRADKRELARAEAELRSLIHEHPLFIDVYHHLAMILESTGRDAEAQVLREKAVLTGLQVFLFRFVREGNLLEWG